MTWPSWQTRWWCCDTRKSTYNERRGANDTTLILGPLRIVIRWLSCIDETFHLSQQHIPLVPPQTQCDVVVCNNLNGNGVTVSLLHTYNTDQGGWIVDRFLPSPCYLQRMYEKFVSLLVPTLVFPRSMSVKLYTRCVPFFGACQASSFLEGKDLLQVCVCRLRWYLHQSFKEQERRGVTSQSPLAQKTQVLLFYPHPAPQNCSWQLAIYLYKYIYRVPHRIGNTCRAKKGGKSNHLLHLVPSSRFS